MTDVNFRHSSQYYKVSKKLCTKKRHISCTYTKHGDIIFICVQRGQKLARARVVARAEVSPRTKTEEKYYTSRRFHEALEKKGKKNFEGVNTQNTFFYHKEDTQNFPTLSFPVFSLLYLSQAIFFSEISRMRITFDLMTIKSINSKPKSG